jgi:transglutaminase/protease-like cytokinesis protein 3
MEKERKEKIQDMALFLLLIIVILISMYVFVFYKASDGTVVETLSNETDYPVYSGKNVYEHWKTTLNDEQKILYEEIKESFLQFNEEFSTQAKNISLDELNEAYTAVLLDHPEIFWMQSYKAVTTLNDNVNTRKKIQLIYAYSEEEAKEIKSRLESSYNEIIDEAKEQDNDFKKIKLVHDRLIQESTYTKYDKDELHEYQSIVSIFDTHNTVCAGYAYGFKFIMDELGIDTIVSRDVSNEDKSKNHIWNMVNLYGTWYNIDITWDDELSENKVIAYNYFLKTNKEFYTNHKLQKNIPVNEE